MLAATGNPNRVIGGTSYWLGPVLTTGIINAAFMLGYVAIYAGEPSALVCADQDKIGRWPFEAVKVGFPTQGYDGQYYYVLARDPWHRHEAFLDAPAYRHSRIVYPTLAWLFAGGDPYLLLWVLPALNWLALLGIAWLGAALAHHYGRTPWWGLMLPFFLNSAAPALRDLADPIATLTACAVVAAWLLRWPAWSFAPLCTLAILSREQNVLVVALVVLESFASRNYRVTKFAAVSLPIWILWVVALRSVYGDWPFLSSNTEPPFAGIWYRLRNMTGRLGSSGSWAHALAMTTLAVHLLCSLKLAVSKPERLTCLIALAGAALAVLGGTAIYAGVESYTRVFWWMPFGIWLWGVQTGRVWPGFLMSFGLLWPCYGLAQAWYKIHQGNVTIL